MIRWEICKENFRVDGSLRDIYIVPVTIADWKILYQFLRGFSEVEYSVDGVICALPDSVEQVFAIRQAENPTLRLRVGQIFIVFHFFSEVEIECDISPREIKSQADLDELLGFVRQLGNVTRKRVIITPENDQGHPFISYIPENNQFEYRPI